MLDTLLGRASLKERIADLEDELESARQQLDAESDRRAAAVTARQEAQEQQNRLEDRIAQLEGELERVADTHDEPALSVRHRETVGGERLAELLERLESVRTGPEGALTATVGADGSVPSLVEEALGDRTSLAADAAPCLVCVDDASLISVALKPPLAPTLEPEWSDRFYLEESWFRPTGRHALALVRTDLFALGVYDDGDRVAYRGFESDVKGAHSKGGFSQARFERIRDDQIDDHITRCLEALEAYEGETLILVGQRGILETIAEKINGNEVVATAAVDATGAPKGALEDAYRSFWTTELRVL